MTKSEKKLTVDFLTNSKIIKLDCFAGNHHVRFCGYRYHFREINTGLRMVNEHSENFEIVFASIVSVGCNDSAIWTTYQNGLILVYTRVE